MTDVDRPVYIDPDQQMLPGLGPVAGDRYRSRHTNSICTVLATTQRRYAWVTVRVRGEQQTLKLAVFMEHWAPLQQSTGR